MTANRRTAIDGTPSGPASSAAPHDAPSAARGYRAGRALLSDLRPSTPLIIAVTIILVGMGLRLHQYFSDRSLWLDEALLAINILNRSVEGLSHPLDFNQAAPLGFLVAIKTLILAFGKSESVLRLLPLLCGISSVPLMYIVARKILSQLAALVALLLFACAPALVYYSSELKQYACDVLAALLIAAIAITRDRPSLRRYAAVAATGAVTIWFSHATVFLVAAVAVTYGIYYLLDRTWRPLLEMVFVSLLCLASFAAFYEVSYQDLAPLQSTLGATTGLGESNSLVTLAASIGDGLGLPLSQGGLPELVRPLSIALALLGAFVLLRVQRRNALILGLPVVFAVIAGALDKYPTTQRALLFIVPALAISIGQGVASISRVRLASPVPAVAAAGALVLIVGYPISNAATNAAHPRQREELRPLIRILVERWRPGDSLYVHYGATYAFRYYAQCQCAGVPDGHPPLSFGKRTTRGGGLFSPALRPDPPRFFVGIFAHDRFQVYERELNRLRGLNRVWILYSHSNGSRQETFLRKKLPRYLDRRGTRLAQFKREHAALLLYDLRKAP